MEKRRRIQGTVYVMVATDVVFVLIIVLLSRFLNIVALAMVCLPALLIFNFLFLRRKFKMVSQAPVGGGALPHSRAFSVYACSAIFFVGTLYGVLMILQGVLPRTILPLLLVPLSLAVYCFRTARRTGAPKSN